MPQNSKEILVWVAIIAIAILGLFLIDKYLPDLQEDYPWIDYIW